MSLFGGAAERLSFVLDLDSSKAISEARKAGDSMEKELGRGDKSASNFGGTLQKTGLGMIAFGGIALAALGKVAQAGEEAHLVDVKLADSVEHAGAKAGGSVQPFADLASEMQKKVAFDDEAIKSSESLQLQMGLTQDQVLKMTPLIADLAAKEGVDLATATDQVTKAVNGKKKGLEAVLGPIDATAYATDHYAAVQALLNSKVGGFAENEGRTFGGQMEILKNQLHDVEEGVGQGAVKAFTAMLGVVTNVTDALENLSPGTQSAIGEVATFGATATIGVGVMSSLAGTVLKARDNFGAFAEMMGLVTVAEEGSEAASVGLLASLGPVGIAAAAVAATIAFVALVNSQDDGAKATKDYTAAIKDQNGELASNIDKVTAGQLAHNKIAQAANDVGISFKLMGETVRTGTDDFGAYKDAIGGDATTPITILAARLRDAGAGSTEFGRALLASVESGQLTAGQAMALTTNIESLHNGYRDATQAVQEEADAQAGVTGSTDSATAAIKRQTQAVQDQSDQLKALVDPLFGAVDGAMRMVDSQAKVADATQKVTDAQKTYNDAVAMFGPQSQPALDAQGKLTDAQNGLNQTNYEAVKAAEGYTTSLDSLRIAVINGDVSLSDAQNTLAGWVQQGIITQAQADQVNVAFQGVNAQAALIPTDISTAVHIDDQDAINQLHYLDSLIAGIDPSVDLQVRIGGGAHALGGVFDEQSADVGEQGKERLVRLGASAISVLPSGSFPNSAAGGAAMVLDNALVIDGRVLARQRRIFDRRH